MAWSSGEVPEIRKGKLQYNKRLRGGEVKSISSEVGGKRKGMEDLQIHDSTFISAKGGVDEQVNRGTILKKLAPPDDGLTLLKGKSKQGRAIEKGGRSGYLDKAQFISIRKPTT